MRLSFPRRALDWALISLCLLAMVLGVGIAITDPRETIKAISFIVVVGATMALNFLIQKGNMDMSTTLYLQCQDHEPKLRSVTEVGQHMTDIPRIRWELENRDVLLVAAESENVEFHGRTQIVIGFMREHPKCTLAITNDIGEIIPEEEI